MLTRALMLLALTLMLTLSTDSFVHAVIPHDHGDSHGGESAVWTSLHGATRAAEKKSIAVAAATAFTLIVFLVLIVTATLPRVRMISVPLLIDPHRGRGLRRGIHKYRRFR